MVVKNRPQSGARTDGNKRFRETITNAVHEYNKAESRMQKSMVVLSVFDSIRARGGRFLKHDETEGSWYELSDQQTKEKIAHAVRDAVNSIEAKRAGKKSPPKGTKQQHTAAATTKRTLQTASQTMDADPAKIPSFASAIRNLKSDVGTGEANDAMQQRSGNIPYPYQGAITNLELGNQFHPQTAMPIEPFLRGTIPHPFSGMGLQQPTNMFPVGSAGLAPDMVSSNFMGQAFGGLQHSASPIPMRESSHCEHASAEDEGNTSPYSSLISYEPHAMAQALPARAGVEFAPTLRFSDDDPFIAQINEVLGPLETADRQDSSMRLYHPPEQNHDVGDGDESAP